MTSFDLEHYLDYYDKKYRGVTQVRTLEDAIFDVANQRQLLAVHDIYSKRLPPQPSRFKERLVLTFQNHNDILDAITVDAHTYKIFDNRLPQPKTVSQFIEDCNRFELKLFWRKEVYNSYFSYV